MFVRIFLIIWNYPYKLSRLHHKFYFHFLSHVKSLILCLNLFLSFECMFFCELHQRYLTSKLLSNLELIILLFFYLFLFILLCLYVEFNQSLIFQYLLDHFILDFLEIIHLTNYFFCKIYNIKLLLEYIKLKVLKSLQQPKQYLHSSNLLLYLEIKLCFADQNRPKPILSLVNLPIFQFNQVNNIK